MTFKKDIIERVLSDFGEEADDAFSLLHAAIRNSKYLETDRLTRCIVYLAKGNLSDLDKYIQEAIIDPRDVMFWAEYTGIKEDENPKRVRDFNIEFGKEEM